MKPRINGVICPRHPELEGLRDEYSKRCVGCRRQNEKDQRQRPERQEWEKEANAARMRDYRAEGKFRSNRQDHIRGRIPQWADLKAIREIYRKAREQGLTVDHIVPLRGKLVSGFHVQNNLQILPKSANSSKGSSFKVE